jgi:hypothetical protein
MQIVSRVHDMPSLLRPIANLTLRAGELISSKETIYDARKWLIFYIDYTRIY